MAKFRITYENGVSQVKTIMHQDYYEFVIKPELRQMYENEEILANMKKPKPGTKQYEKFLYIKNDIRLTKKYINEFGEFFTSKSPLGKALINSKNLIGLLELPEHQGGSQKVIFERVIL